jgi:hypothetical protein
MKMEICKASSENNFLIPRCGEPHTIAEYLILRSVEDRVLCVLGYNDLKIIKKVSFPNYSVSGIIEGMTFNVKYQLIK